ncbi:phosphate uptake regulator PhoU [Methanospirillum lacunae]|uniref:PhoU family transcriptional regulator n=1 Tax=Methanospirillum lacunae TaxID=668570 RepID=A0A2V2MW83_9EURY|nr:phosphate uptake regulator PhoU [Methanospirillum lacunae]PWR72142.1 PhoU family transcriptional regulator [Methanospirillum lacunae]
MDIRRVQMTGGSSYVLTLPKEWVTSLNIRKNDPVGVMIQADGDLMITGNLSGDLPPRSRVVTIDQGMDSQMLFRILVGIYIAGYNIIEIKSKDRIQGTLRRTIRAFSDQVIGLEPVEEEETIIILRDLFNPLDMPLDTSFRRMYAVTHGMLTDSAEGLKSCNQGRVQDVEFRDRDVDRLFWLISRQTNMILQSPRNAERMKTNISEVLHYLQTGRIVERVADHCVLIARSINMIEQEILAEDVRVVIGKAMAEADKLFELSISAFFSRDMKKANRVLGTTSPLEQILHQINQDILALPTDSVMVARKITDSIRRIGEYSGDIAERVIDFGVIPDARSDSSVS